MFEVDVNGLTQQYRSKPVMNVDTVPKPLTYDYMPEGYPSKSTQIVTLMEEQEVVFADMGGIMGAELLVVSDIKPGDKLTVVWDGVSYDAVVKKPPKDHESLYMFGNLALIGMGEATDYPFAYMGGDWATTDTATSHTIKVMRQQIKYTPIDANYMPEGYPNEARVTEMINTALGVIENGSY